MEAPWNDLGKYTNRRWHPGWLFFLGLNKRTDPRCQDVEERKKKEESAVKEGVLHKKQKILIIRRTMDLGREEADFLYGSRAVHPMSW